MIYIDFEIITVLGGIGEGAKKQRRSGDGDYVVVRLPLRRRQGSDEVRGDAALDTRPRSVFPQVHAYANMREAQCAHAGARTAHGWPIRETTGCG